MSRGIYDFLGWSWTINTVPIEGFAEGDDVVKIERADDSISHMVGADGKMSPFINASRITKVTFKLAATSRSNTYLQALADLEEGGFGTYVPILLGGKDANFKDAVTGFGGYITKPADMGRGVKASDEDWVFVFERVDFVRGGAGIPNL